MPVLPKKRKINLLVIIRGLYITYAKPCHVFHGKTGEIGGPVLLQWHPEQDPPEQPAQEPPDAEERKAEPPEEDFTAKPQTEIWRAVSPD